MKFLCDRFISLLRLMRHEQFVVCCGGVGSPCVAWWEICSPPCRADEKTPLHQWLRMTEPAWG